MRKFRHFLLFFVLGLFLPPYVLAQESHIVIFHTTDTHGYIVTDDKTIGLDLVAGIFRATPNAVLVDAGDYLMGLAPAALSQGRDVVALMKLAGYFAVAVGNHEFDHGPDELMQRFTEASASPNPMHMLSANARDKAGKPLFPAAAAAPTDGVKLCFFGLTTQGSKFSVTPSYIKDIAFDDVVESARDTVAEQRAAGCDIVVALSHVGSRKERFATSRDLAKAPGIDLIIDGHSHVVVDEKLADGPLLVSAGAHGRNLGRVDIFYDKRAKKITRMESVLINRAQAGAYSPDSNVARELATLTARLDKELSGHVGKLEYSLNGSRTVVRAMEAPLGNLFADTLRAAYPCDIALVNGGGLRDGLKKGDISFGDIVRVVPFRDQIVTLRVTGEELRQVLEFGFSKLPELSGAFPQISGLTVRLAPERPAGERVLAMQLEDGSPIDPDKEYILATNDYVAKGGDGYPVLASKELINAGKNAQQAAVAFFAAHSTEQYKNGMPRRIIIVKPEK